MITLRRWFGLSLLLMTLGIVALARGTDQGSPFYSFLGGLLLSIGGVLLAADIWRRSQDEDGGD